MITHAPTIYIYTRYLLNISDRMPTREELEGSGSRIPYCSSVVMEKVAIFGCPQEHISIFRYMYLFRIKKKLLHLKSLSCILFSAFRMWIITVGSLGKQSK